MKNKRLSFLFKIPLYFFGGLIFSCPYTGGSFSPFAAPFAAAAEGTYSLAAAAGSITGTFIFHSGLTSFRYFAISLTSSAILSIILKAFRLRNESFMRILCPTVCCFAVNLLFLLSQEFSADLLFSVICETVMCGLSVPVFSQALKQLRGGTVRSSHTEKDFICFIFFVSLAAAHLCFAGIAGEAAGLFVMWFIIPAFSQLKGFEGGIITGVCCSFVSAMSGDADFASAMFSVCGCLCSFFSFPKRYYKSAVVFFCSAAACAFGEYTDFLPSVPASAAAGVLFCLLPDKIFEAGETDGDEEPVEMRCFSGKSGGIASAVMSLSDCICAARRAIRPMIFPEIKTELFRAREKVCGECEICDSCINEIKKNDNPCFDRIASALSDGTADITCFPEKFNLTCWQSGKMLDEMTKAYFVYCTNVSAENRISRIQTVTGNQFRTFGEIIGRACEDVVGTAVITSRRDSSLAASAQEFGVEIKDARLCTDKAGRDYYDLSFVKSDNNFSVTALTEKLAADTGCQLDFPTLIQNGNICDLVFRQKEKISFQIAAAVRPGSGNGVCGDYYRCFKDSFSRQTVLLSDGMGTGKRAAVDSAFTCETFCNLIKSGIDEKAAADAVNCAMMIKSTDESLSTIDFLRLDPILKTAEIFKCGAAPSFVLHKKTVSVIETVSAPIGILDSVNMSSGAFDIEAGDIILIVSDGVSGDRYSWIINELKSWNKNSANALARHILQCAADRKIGRRSDDMTVIAVCAAEN